jgi:HD-like signal output (HDOD) protein
MRLDALLKQPHALPTAPRVALRLVRTFEAEDVDLTEIAEEIETDPALTARVLQQANSSLFRLMRPVATVRDAVMVLGLNKVRALVLAMAMNNSFKGVEGLDLEVFWRYSLCTATLARYICQPLRLDENIAFTAGLLHGVGELVMHMGMPVYMQQLDAGLPLLDLERARRQKEALGYSYAAVGAELAREWRLPKALVEVIGQHDRPLEADPPQPLAAVLHLAAWRARVQFSATPRETLIYTYPDAVGLLLGIDPDSLVTDDIPPLHGLLWG